MYLSLSQITYFISIHCSDTWDKSIGNNGWNIKSINWNGGFDRCFDCCYPTSLVFVCVHCLHLQSKTKVSQFSNFSLAQPIPCSNQHEGKNICIYHLTKAQSAIQCFTFLNNCFYNFEISGQFLELKYFERPSLVKLKRAKWL